MLAELARVDQRRESSAPAGCTGTCGPASARGPARSASAISSVAFGQRAGERLLDERVLARLEHAASRARSACRSASRSRTASSVESFEELVEVSRRRDRPGTAARRRPVPRGARRRPRRARRTGASTRFRTSCGPQ